MTGQDPGHTHRMPRALLVTLVVICVGLLASIVLVSVVAIRAGQQAEETNRRLVALEQFIEDRGVERDQQYENLDGRITHAICGLLDGLPAEWSVLNGLREQNGCGPGIPIDQLPPETQRDLSRWETPDEPAIAARKNTDN